MLTPVSLFIVCLLSLLSLFGSPLAGASDQLAVTETSDPVWGV